MCRCWRDGEGRICRSGLSTSTLRRCKRLSWAGSLYQPRDKSEKNVEKGKKRYRKMERTERPERRKGREVQRGEALLFVPQHKEFRTGEDHAEDERQSLEEGVDREDQSM